MNEQLSIKPIALKYAAITGVFSFGYSVLLTSMGKSQDPFLQYLSVLVFITATIFAYKEYRTNNNDILLFKTGVKLGTLMSFIAASITSMLNYFYVKFVDDSAVKQAIEITKTALEGNPEISDEQYEMMIELVEKLSNSPLPHIMSAFFLTFFGFILSLAISQMMKKEPAKEDQDYDF